MEAIEFLDVIFLLLKGPFLFFGFLRLNSSREICKQAVLYFDYLGYRNRFRFRFSPFFIENTLVITTLLSINQNIATAIFQFTNLCRPQNSKPLFDSITQVITTIILTGTNYDRILILIQRTGDELFQGIRTFIGIEHFIHLYITVNWINNNYMQSSLMPIFIANRRIINRYSGKISSFVTRWWNLHNQHRLVIFFNFTLKSFCQARPCDLAVLLLILRLF